MIKINILYDFKDTPFGGGNQFLKALRDQLIKTKQYSLDPWQADIILFNSYPTNNEQLFNLAYRLKKSGKIIVNRLDGPIQLIRGQKGRYIDQVLYFFNKKFCEGTIFQSNWSFRQNIAKGWDKSNVATVIINAPNPQIFKKKKYNLRTKKKYKIVITSWSDNWQKGFATYLWLDDNLDFSKYSIDFYGNTPCKFKNIKVHPALPSKHLARQLQKYDIFLTASRNETCSNSLIEALHCGLPAIALKDGGHPQIIKKGGLLFINDQQIPAILEKLTKNYLGYCRKISLLNIEQVTQKYINFMQQACQQKIKKTKLSDLLILKLIIFRGKLVNKIIRIFYNLV